MKFLLDTNVLSAIATRKSVELTERFVQTTRAHLCTSVVVWHEVQFGLAANEAIALKLRPIYTMLFEGLQELPTTQAVWTRAANLRAELKLKGTPIGPFALLIAATALEHNLTLVTNNLKEFERVQGLKFETWIG